MLDDIKNRLIGRISSEDNNDVGVITARLPNKEDTWETALIINNRHYIVATYRFEDEARTGHEYWVKHARIDDTFMSKYPECTVDRNGNKVRSKFRRY